MVGHRAHRHRGSSRIAPAEAGVGRTQLWASGEPLQIHFFCLYQSSQFKACRADPTVYKQHDVFWIHDLRYL